MAHDAETYLADIVAAGEFALGFAGERTLDEYVRDRAFRDVIERELMIVGEAVFVLERRFPKIVERIGEADKIIGLRHVLVHGYGGLRHENIWQILRTKLPVLIAEVKGVLSESA